MKSSIIGLFLFSLVQIFQLQSEEMTLFFENLQRIPIAKYEDNINPLFILRSDTFLIDSKILIFKIPDADRNSDLAFAKLYFMGWENPPFYRQTTFLFVNYKSNNVKIIADLNNNLDFRDDNCVFFISDLNQYAYINLINQNNSEGKFLYRLGKFINIDSTILILN